MCSIIAYQDVKLLINSVLRGNWPDLRNILGLVTVTQGEICLSSDARELALCSVGC